MKLKENYNHKAIRAISLTLCVLIFSGYSWFRISEYNSAVRQKHLILKAEANGEKFINFGLYSLNKIPDLALLFTTLLLAFTICLFFTKRFLLSSLFTFFIFLNLIMLPILLDSFRFYVFLQNHLKIDWTENFFYVEFILLIIVILMSFIQTRFICRFIDDNFRAKISLR